MLAAALLIAVVIFPGCTTGRTGRATYAPAQSPAPSIKLPQLNTNRVDPTLVRSEAAGVQNRFQKLFIDAREAYFDHGTDSAVAGLRALLESHTSSTPFPKWFIQALIVQCHEEAGEWQKAAASSREFGLDLRDPERVGLAEALARHPDRILEFAPETTTNNFDLAGGQLIFVRVEINGQPGRFLLDTGFSRSLITPEFAQRAAVPGVKAKVNLIDSNQKDRAATMGVAANLQFCGVTALHVPVVISSVGMLRQIDRRVDGVIGWDLLQEMDLTLDFVARRMAVREPVDPAPPGPHNLVGRKTPVLTVLSAEGKPLDLFLDTGFMSKPVGVHFFRNAGLLDTRIKTGDFRRTWRPSLSSGMHSISVRWPKWRRDFAFSMDAVQITVPVARMTSRISVLEGFHTCDGIIGNGPFLGGVLKINGRQRRSSFTTDQIQPTVNP